jgi:hypothetical protein
MASTRHAEVRSHHRRCSTLGRARGAADRDAVDLYLHGVVGDCALGERPCASSPPVGISRGAELTATAIWLPLGGGQASLEVRLANLGTGAIAGGGRQVIPADAEPVGAARAIVATILETLSELGRLPDWIDPLEGIAPAAYRPARVPESTVEAFWEGLAEEERWNWEPARRSYSRRRKAWASSRRRSRLPAPRGSDREAPWGRVEDKTIRSHRTLRGIVRAAWSAGTESDVSVPRHR